VRSTPLGTLHHGWECFRAGSVCTHRAAGNEQQEPVMAKHRDGAPAVLDLDSGMEFCGLMTAKGAGRYGQGLIRLGKARTATWTLA
jgi:hypothetical protein